MRVMQSRQEFMTREEVAAEWFEEDYEPIVASLREADLIGTATETEAYVRIITLRYMLLRTHEWDERVLERLREELRRPRRPARTPASTSSAAPARADVSRSGARRSRRRRGAGSRCRPRARPRRRA